jgi:hypothetical protein
MSEFKFLVSAGHDAYALPDQEGLTLVWGYEDVEPFEEDGGSVSDKALREAFRTKLQAETVESTISDWDLWYEVIYRIEMDRPQLEENLRTLIEDLKQDPGGDDGTFDYWPSGVRFAMQLAERLGGEWPQKVAAFARNWIMENRAEFAYELLNSVGLD